MNWDVAIRSGDSQILHLKNAVGMPIVVAVAYYLAAEVAFLVGTFSDKIFAPFWPPNTVLFCALMLVPRHRWWLCILAAFPAHLISELGIGMSAPQLLVAFVTNCLVAIMSALSLQYLLGAPPWLTTLRRMLQYILAAVILSPALVAFGGAFVPAMAVGAPAEYWTFWTQWYMANALAGVALGPLALAYFDTRASRRAQPLSTIDLVEATVVAIALIFVCVVVFKGKTDNVPAGLLPALLYLPLPLILWITVRFGVKGASFSVFVVTILLVAMTLNGPSLFIIADPERNVFAIQVFLIGLAVPVLLLGAAIDETRHAERTTRESEERMALAAVAADLCLWHFNYDDNRFWITDHGRRMFGFSPDQVITRDVIIDTAYPDDHDIAYQVMDLAATPEGTADTEFRITRRNDGQTRWLRARVSTVRDDQGSVVQISGTFADVTARKAMEDELAQQHRDVVHLMRVSMLSELSGGIAHELTQPLTAILSNAQAARLLLEDKSPDLVEISAALDDIIGEDHRAGEVIHRMRSLLKKGAASLERIDVNELIASTLSLLKGELISRRIQASCEYADHLPLIFADLVQLQQVFINILMNSFEAMNDVLPSQRLVSIQTRPISTGGVQILIADRGHGLAPLHQHQVFEPYFSTKERGLGLGLSICSSIIRAHGGCLMLENRDEGGAVATITLTERALSAA